MMARTTYIEQLVRIKFRSTARVRRRQIAAEDARECYLRQYVSRATIKARYDRAVQLLLEARALDDRLRDTIYPKGD
jgi:hypothetical protein